MLSVICLASTDSVLAIADGLHTMASIRPDSSDFFMVFIVINVAVATNISGFLLKSVNRVLQIVKGE